MPLQETKFSGHRVQLRRSSRLQRCNRFSNTADDPIDLEPTKQSEVNNNMEDDQQNSTPTTSEGSRKKRYKHAAKKNKVKPGQKSTPDSDESNEETYSIHELYRAEFQATNTNNQSEATDAQNQSEQTEDARQTEDQTEGNFQPPTEENQHEDQTMDEEHAEENQQSQSQEEAQNKDKSPTAKNKKWKRKKTEENAKGNDKGKDVPNPPLDDWNSHQNDDDLWEEWERAQRQSVQNEIFDPNTVSLNLNNELIPIMEEDVYEVLGLPWSKLSNNMMMDRHHPKRYNWAEFLISYLVSATKSWNENASSHFRGSAIFLTLFYADRVRHKGIKLVERQCPSFKGWTQEKLRERQAIDDFVESIRSMANELIDTKLLFDTELNLALQKYPTNKQLLDIKNIVFNVFHQQGTEKTTNTGPPEQTTKTLPPEQTTNTRPTYSRPSEQCTDSSPPEENTDTEEFQDCYEEEDFQLTIEDVEQLDLLSFVDSAKINAQQTELFETDTNATLDEKKTLATTYKLFAENVDSMLNQCNRTKLDLIDMAFFPICAFEHYYLIVYHLKNWSYEIIDNIDRSKIDPKKCYGEKPKILDGQDHQLIKLRIKYNNAILSSQLNQKRKEILKQGKELYIEAASKKLVDLVINSSQQSQEERQTSTIVAKSQNKKKVTFAKNLITPFNEVSDPQKDV
uniref:Ubiquitin-like protease family profile domain-containing protein n=1 Tax=Daucus carota subsp. sativus TaxID=79200 RepID=A0A164Z972_DAUCS